MTTLATCWKLTRKDAAIFAFTDHDLDLTVSGTTYESAVGFVPSAVERSTELQADNQVLTGIIDSSTLSAAELRTGKFEGARVEVIEVDWTTQAKVRTLYAGFLGKVDIVGNQYSATALSLESELVKSIGRIVGLRCDADLGDARCGFSLTSDSLSVTSVASRLSFVDTALTAADGYYANGKVTWLTGSNAGLTFDIKRYIAATDTIELFEPTPYAIQVGDTGNLFRGCDKTIETCRDSFSNLNNFRGFPYLPGVKDLVSGNASE